MQSLLDKVTTTPKLDELHMRFKQIEEPECDVCGSTDLYYKSDFYEDEDGTITDADIVICNDCGHVF